MAAPDGGRRHLKLSVSNFGPIGEGEVELRPMTVFVGPSNTGKSYLATLIYALHGFFGAYAGGAGGGIFRERFYNFGMPTAFPKESVSLADDDIATLSGWMRAALPALERGRGDAPELKPYRIPDDVAALARPVMQANVQLRGQVLFDEITRCFGVGNAADLLRYPAGDRMEFRLRGNGDVQSDDGGCFEFKGFAAGDEFGISALVSGGAPMHIGKDVQREIQFSDLLMFGKSLLSDARERDSNALGVLGCLATAAIADQVAPLCRPAYYLPADRGGIMRAHQLAVRGLIARASRLALRPDAPMPALSGVLGDFLEQIVDLPELPRIYNADNTNRLALRLEARLLKGGIEVEQSPVGYPSFRYRPMGWERDISLMNASSMIAELAPLAIYLRYAAGPGDTLIIEEPESHLHPEMQVRLVRELAAAVKAGIRIIITTHSEWVLEELANLVRLSDLPPAKRGGIEGIEGGDVALGPDEFGAWFFEPGQDGGGSRVKEMPLDIEIGNFQSGFALVTEDTYNRWARISNRIEREARCRQQP